MEISSEGTNGVRVVHRALAILECFVAKTPVLSLQAIAIKIDLPKTTVFRLLATLIEAGYVVQTPAQEYCLSHKIMRLASAAQRTFSIIDLAMPIMTRVARETEETLDLSMQSGTSRVCLAVLESPHPLKSIIVPGELLPLLHGAASGKVLMAYADPLQLETILESAPGGPRRKQLIADLAKIRREGMAYTRGERVPGASAISVPLRDSSGAVRHCLTVVGPSFRFDSQAERFKQIMIDGGREISSLLGGVDS